MPFLLPFSSGQLLSCDEKGVVLAYKGKIIRSYGNLREVDVLAAKTEGTKYKFWDDSALISRVTRSGCHAFIETKSYKFVLKDNCIFSGGLDDTVLEKAFTIPRGRRPLNFCHTPNQQVYFGEYFGNRSRDSVFIYGTDDGYNWSRRYQFSKGKVRHIHGLFWDKYRSGIWILTGDSNTESALWFTSDNFRNVEYIVGGSQKYRAVSIILKKEGLYIPMDSPTEKNFLHFLDLNSMELKIVAELPNSAFDIVDYGNIQLMTTVPEPSGVNDSVNVFLMASFDCERWYNLKNFRGDFLSRVVSKRFFQYPRLSLASGVFDGMIFGYARSLTGIRCGTVAISIDNIKNKINGN